TLKLYSRKELESMLGIRANAGKTGPSPLEGFGAFRAQQAETELKQLGQGEWWLWVSALSVTLLSTVAFLLTAFESFFLHREHFYEIRSDQARWAGMCLLLLFNGWMVFRQWVFRRRRRELTARNGNTDPGGTEISDPTGVDPATGLYTRASAEQQLAREMPRHRRRH